MTTQIPGLPRYASGKVRDIYLVGEDAVLLVATDRISAFDVVMGEGIPDKGRVLTELSRFWFERTRHIIPNHLLTIDDEEIAIRLIAAGAHLDESVRRQLAGRCLLCRRTAPLPIEAVVRGYLSGSGWKEYRAASPYPDGHIDLWGVSLPAGLRESDRLPEPIFTPSTKAAAGHDEPMLQNEIASYIGEWAEPVRTAAIDLYAFARDFAAERGILLADTKFEFGITSAADGSPQLLLIDEALTPDSSRFWDATTYSPGGPQPSFDKQPVRDYLDALPSWNKQPPPPPLPIDVVQSTAARYRDAFRRLTGEDLTPLSAAVG